MNSVLPSSPSGGTPLLGCPPIVCLVYRHRFARPISALLAGLACRAFPASRCTQQSGDAVRSEFAAAPSRRLRLSRGRTDFQSVRAPSWDGLEIRPTASRRPPPFSCSARGRNYNGWREDPAREREIDVPFRRRLRFCCRVAADTSPGPGSARRRTSRMGNASSFAQDLTLEKDRGASLVRGARVPHVLREPTAWPGAV